jgi:hypothetical protein
LGTVLKGERLFAKAVVVQRFRNVPNAPEIAQAETKVQIFAVASEVISANSCPRAAFDDDGWMTHSWPLLEESLSDSRMFRGRTEAIDHAGSNNKRYSRAKHDHVAVIA